MNERENHIVELLGQAFVEFRALDVLHPSDLPEFVTAIHAAQNIVLSRAALRARNNADLITAKAP